MWLLLAFLSAMFLGFYDASKKASLKNNAVLPVLLLNTLFCTIIFSPYIIGQIFGCSWFDNSAFSESTSTADYTHPILHAHIMVVLKAIIVLSSWICGYFGLKHLPLTIVGPINATRPVMVLIGAMLVFGEKLNIYQWIGVILAIGSIFMMSRAGKKEDIDFKNNRWIWCVALAAILGAVSGLYDKHLMNKFNPLFVQSWFNLYQLAIMSLICGLLWWPTREKTTPFRWSWSIPLISIFISLADYAYLTSLNDASSMISVVSLVRRSSVIISFICGVIIFKERNIKAKLLDLGLILLGMFFIWMGTEA